MSYHVSTFTVDISELTHNFSLQAHISKFNCLHCSCLSWLTLVGIYSALSRNLKYFCFHQINIFFVQLNLQQQEIQFWHACSCISCKSPRNLADKSAAGILTQLLILCRRLRANAVSPSSAEGSMRQNEPFPGSVGERATLMKYLLRERLCRTAFCTDANVVEPESHR